MKVKTKQLQDGIWCCYATINGFDYSFSSKDMDSAQQIMRDKVLSINYDSVIEWLPPQIIPKRKKIKRLPIGYAFNRIDNLK